MRITRTELPGVLVIEPQVFGDERGFFLESFNQQKFAEAIGEHVEFAQDNHSHSRRGVLRGLHYQVPPHAQGKLVRVVRGSVFDVVVDIRESSPSYGRWLGLDLSESNHRQIWIPPGLAHGFLVTSEGADLLYKATAYYAPQHERCVRWNDPTIAVNWPLADLVPILSDKDAHAPLLRAGAG